MGYSKNRPFVKVDVTGEVDKRFDEVTSRLAEKAQDNEVRKLAIKLELEDMSSSTLGAMAGTATYNLLSIPQDLSVTTAKTNFMDVGKNKFNKDAVTVDYYVNNTTGALGANAAYVASDYIPILPNINYVENQGYHMAFYSTNKVFISGNAPATTPRTFVTPVNAYYMRISVTPAKLPLLQVEIGSVATLYESYKLIMPKLVLTNPNSVSSENLRPASVTREKISFYVPEAKVTKNLFDKDKASVGFFVNQTTGELSASSIHASSEFIKVDPSTNYSFVSNDGGRIAFYNMNKTFISGLLAPIMPLTTPVTCEYIRFSFPISSLSFDTQQFEQSITPTEFVTYGFTLPDLINEDDISDSVFLNIPPTIYGLVGQELNIYFDNIIIGRDEDYIFDIVGVGDHYKNFWRYVPDVSETRSITISVYKDNEVVASASTQLVITDVTVGDGVSKNVLVIGDSTTNNGIAVTKLNENFSTDVMNISTIGTRGTAPNLHEGRSGWTSELYVTESDSTNGAGENVINEFWNPSTSSFDFNYYIINNSLDIPNYVVINLGINDVFAVTSDEELETLMVSMVGYYDEMISSIHAYDPTIQVGLALTIPPNYSQDAFGKAYRSGQNRTRYKRNNILWVEKMIETYKGRDAENIYLISTNTNLDTRYNMGLEETPVNARNSMTYTSPIANGGVHPVESGYWQIADIYWYFIKSFEV